MQTHELIYCILVAFTIIIITVGIFSFLSYEVNLSIVAAVLTIVGYSMNDTVVIFDRVRENLKKHSSKNIKEISDLILWKSDQIILHCSGVSSRTTPRPGHRVGRPPRRISRARHHLSGPQCTDCRSPPGHPSPGFEAQ